MALSKVVSRALMEIQNGQEQIIFDSLQVGDIVQVFGGWDGNEGIVIRKTVTSLGPCIDTLIIAGSSYHIGHHYKMTDLVKFYFLDSNIIREFKIRLQWAHEFHHNIIDNLTYIEILARLGEYESRIS